MRIITQDGKKDIPYECFVIELVKQNYDNSYSIKAYSVFDTFQRTAETFLGNYKTKQKALEVMEAMRTEWVRENSVMLGGRCNTVYQMP